MFKFHRAVAVISSVLALGAMAGCSNADDDESGATDQAVAQAEAPLARFNQYLKTLKAPLESGKGVEQVAQQLLNSGRPAAFSLQALARLYEKQDKQFASIRDDFKSLEDGIGGYGKWDEIYSAAVSAGKDEATLTRLKASRDEALAKFKTMLTSRQWIKDAGPGSPKMESIETFLSTYKWKSRKEDRTVVLDHLIKEMQDLKDTKYDMTLLEYGDGIHEIRRDLRWILIEQNGLNGMVVTKKECSVPAYKDFGEDGRYTSLKSSAMEPSPCQLSLCLVSAISNAVSEFGDLKDQAEQEVNMNGKAEEDVVPERLQPAAKKLYEEIQTNDLFGQYINQLNACKAAL